MLYKYRSLSNYTLRILINGEVYFAQPSQLNDPFDCQLSLNKSFRAEILKSQYQAGHHSTLNTSKQMTLYGQGLTLAGLIEQSENLLSDIDDRLEKSGIFSLSEDPVNTLLWAHYADNHKGICIGFDISDKNYAEVFSDETIYYLKVIYKKIDPIKSYFEDRFRKQKTKLPFLEPHEFNLLARNKLSFKSLPWRYEKEVRLISSQNRQVKFLKDHLKEIIFGLHVDNEDKKTVIELVNQLGYTVNFYTIKVSSDFSLTKELFDTALISR